MSETPPADPGQDPDIIAANAATAAASMRDQVMQAHFQANGGKVSVAQAYSFADVALATVDYENMLAGYGNANNVAAIYSAGGTPTTAQSDAYTTTRGAQGGTTRIAL